jgi:methionine synthase II (cobalamin-independent)
MVNSNNSGEDLDVRPTIETDEPAIQIKRKPGRPKGSVKIKAQNTAPAQHTHQVPLTPLPRRYTRTHVCNTPDTPDIPNRAPSQSLPAVTRRKKVDTKPLRKSWVAYVNAGRIMTRAQMLELEDEVERVMDTCDARVDAETVIADWTTPVKP